MGASSGFNTNPYNGQMALPKGRVNLNEQPPMGPRKAMRQQMRQDNRAMRQLGSPGNAYPMPYEPMQTPMQGLGQLFGGTQQMIDQRNFTPQFGTEQPFDFNQQSNLGSAPTAQPSPFAGFISPNYNKFNTGNMEQPEMVNQDYTQNSMTGAGNGTGKGMSSGATGYGQPANSAQPMGPAGGTGKSSSV